MTISNILKLESEKENKNNNNNRYHNSIFNRSSRYNPPIKIEYDDYIAHKNFPRPFGIRPKDHCLPSQLEETLKSMIEQITYFKNFDSNERKEILKILKCR